MDRSLRQLRVARIVALATDDDQPIRAARSYQVRMRSLGNAGGGGLVTVLVTVFLSRPDFRRLAVARPKPRRGWESPGTDAVWLALAYGSDGTRTRDLRRDRPAL